MPGAFQPAPLPLHNERFGNVANQLFVSQDLSELRLSKISAFFAELNQHVVVSRSRDQHRTVPFDNPELDEVIAYPLGLTQGLAVDRRPSKASSVRVDDEFAQRGRGRRAKRAVEVTLSRQESALRWA